ncbi:hypothetical protein B0I35DRAFT_446631 [Stachybotrys elegans]|uniref:Uncharacterized protein n=1 Tax=Stachybotrys elegans TaxID=80388 RepID=A0A8K0WKJ6_9HYPO|nr:hypothetical protein B0I35DRAFT_446631 [Stachybotrys elegans]
MHWPVPRRTQGRTLGRSRLSRVALSTVPGMLTMTIAVIYARARSCFLCSCWSTGRHPWFYHVQQAGAYQVVHPYQPSRYSDASQLGTFRNRARFLTAALLILLPCLGHAAYSLRHALLVACRIGNGDGQSCICSQQFQVDRGGEKPRQHAQTRLF